MQIKTKSVDLLVSSCSILTLIEYKEKPDKIRCEDMRFIGVRNLKNVKNTNQNQ